MRLLWTDGEEWATETTAEIPYLGFGQGCFDNGTQRPADRRLLAVDPGAASLTPIPIPLGLESVCSRRPRASST